MIFQYSLVAVKKRKDASLVPENTEGGNVTTNDEDESC